MSPAEPAPAGPAPGAASGAPALELAGIDKRFGAVHANRDIALRVEPGTIHGLIGENGAGKSTLMSIVYGFYQADAGEIRVHGRPVSIRSPTDAIAAGIGMVHQHFMLVEPFTVLENVILGAEGGPRLRPGLARAREALEQLERDYEIEAPLDTPVGRLSVGMQQRVEILKAFYRGADILILDEPTGVLTPAEADHLFRILRNLRDSGKTVLLVTHKLREIMAVTDRVSVMRRGEMMATVDTASTTPAELAELMVGRRVLLQVDKPAVEPGRTILEARDLSLVDDQGVARLDKVSFQVRAGEIVGIAGVAGNGQSELLEVLAGLAAPTAGEVLLEGTALSPDRDDPARRRDLRLAHVPEDRRRTGLVIPFEANESAILGYHCRPAYGRVPFLDYRGILAATADMMERYDVRPRDPRLGTGLFSGGNQQKIVLAREIDQDPEVLIVGQPTRGVDIGAIESIHRRLVELRGAGKAILLVSVELDEIRALADRILVMFAGAIIGSLPGTASEAEIGALMAGVSEPSAEDGR